MSNKKSGYEICAGALCLCTFGTTPAKFKVLAQKKHYINDPNGTAKLIATHKEVGQPFELPYFGTCSKMNNKPCTVSVTGWSDFYDGVTFENKGHPLLDSSKGTCALGAPDCISFSWHGQVAAPLAHTVDKRVMSIINPLVKIEQIS